MPSQACIDAVQLANKSAGGKELSTHEIKEIFKTVDETRERIKAEGGFDDAEARLKEAMAEGAKEQVFQAAVKRRNAAINIRLKFKAEGVLDELTANGMSLSPVAFTRRQLSPVGVVLSMWEGNVSGTKMSRKSIDTTKLAYEMKYYGVNHEVMAAAPELSPKVLMSDKALSDNIKREVVSPGSTSSKVAKDLAPIYQKWWELIRRDGNRLSASIAKLEGWLPRHWDPQLIIKNGGREGEKFGKLLLNEIDWKRTAQGWLIGKPDEKKLEFLEHARRGIMGLDDDATITGARGSNMAKQMSHHRQLHFKDVEAEIRVADLFQGKTTLHGATDALASSRARQYAEMEWFGDNPDNMLQSLLQSMQRRIENDAGLTRVEKDKARKMMGDSGLDGNNSISRARREARGMTLGIGTEASTTAKVLATGRIYQGVTKLGSAVMTAGVLDPGVSALASFQRGGKPMAAFGRAWARYFRRRPTGEELEQMASMGVGLDTFLNELASPLLVHDLPRGWASRKMQQMVRYTGFGRQTDVIRMSSAATIQAEFGHWSAKSFDGLKLRVRHNLGKHGIGNDEWEILRQSVFSNSQGTVLSNPTIIRDLPDEAFDALVQRRVRESVVKGATPSMLKRYARDARHDSEMQLRGLLIDEINFSNPILDAKARRHITRGTAGSTGEGQVYRSLWIFKSFALVFGRKVVGRGLFGGPGEGFLERTRHVAPQIGTLLAVMTMGGYVKNTLADAVVRGEWPPQNPADPAVLLRAMLTSGAAGLVGDILLRDYTEYNLDIFDTLAGPLFGDLKKIFMIGLVDPVWNQTFNKKNVLELVKQNTPYINFWYTKLAIDYLFVNEMREYLNPGWIDRMSARSEERGQTRAESANRDFGG
jgi:hypothetical protein